MRAEIPSGDPLSADAAVPRPRRLPAWTWLLLHFAFVASLAVVWHRREPWVKCMEQSGAVENSISFSPDGSQFVANNSRQKATIWDVASGGAVKVIEDPTESISWALFAQDGRRVVTCHNENPMDMPCEKGIFNIWSARTGEKLFSVRHPLGEERQERSLWMLESTEAGVFVTSAAQFGYASGKLSLRTPTCVWDAASGRKLYELDGLAADVSPDGRLLALVDGTQVKLWDFATRRPVGLLDGHADQARLLQFSPRGSSAITLDAKGWMREWKWSDGSIPMRRHVPSARAATYVLNGEVVLVVVSAVEVAPWMTLKFVTSGGGQDQAAIPHAHSWSWLSHGRRIAVYHTDEKARIWDAQAGKMLAVLSHEDVWLPSDHFTGGTVELSPDGDHLALVAHFGNVLHLFRRRFPEWWWGHFYRPEVWAAIVLGGAWLWSVARWAKGRMRERRAAGSEATPASA